MNTNPTSCPPCSGNCNQGRTCGVAQRWPVLRETRPGELAPNPPDPAEAVSPLKGAAVAALCVAGCLLLALIAHAVAASGVRL